MRCGCQSTDTGADESALQKVDQPGPVESAIEVKVKAPLEKLCCGWVGSKKCPRNDFDRVIGPQNPTCFPRPPVSPPGIAPLALLTS